MIRIKDHKQKEVFDHWSFLSPKRRELLDQSWAGLFQRELLSELPAKLIIHSIATEILHNLNQLRAL